MDTVLQYLSTYGYIIIFIALFFGITGIPAPEETLLFILGVMIAHGQLSFWHTILYSFSGALVGMVTAYACGKFLGKPFVQKFGKYLGLTEERWQKTEDFYSRNARRTIVFSFFLPGLRQISPYFSGLMRLPFPFFFGYATLGSALWTVPYILIGLLTARHFPIDERYLPYLSLIFIAFFILSLAIGFYKRKKESNSAG